MGQNHKLPKSSKHLETVIICPICQKSFGKDQTYGKFEKHFVECENKSREAESFNESHKKSSGFEHEYLTDLFKFSKQSPKPMQFDSSAQLSYDQKIRLKSEKSAKKKYKEFKRKIDSIRVHWTSGADSLMVDRSHLIENTLVQLPMINLKKEVKIGFLGEVSTDAGGLIREWINIMLKEMLSSEIGLFSLCDTDEAIYTINESSKYENYAFKELYELFGKVIAKGMFEKIPMNLNLTNFIYKSLLDDKLVLKDLKTFDTSLYKSLRYIKKNSIDDNDGFEFYFTVPSINKKGQIYDEELIPEGAAIRVTDKNKNEFIQRRLMWVGFESISPQLNALKNGFNSLIPKNFISSFTCNELKTIIMGETKIDIKDWKKNTIYRQPYSPEHWVIKWFWEAVETYNQKQLQCIVQYCTGTPNIPLGGFQVLESNRGNISKFCIESIPYNKNFGIPRAHTCFNRLTLPFYPDYPTLKKNLDYVIQNEILGFGID